MPFVGGKSVPVFVIVLLGAAALFPFFFMAGYVHPLGIHEWDWISSKSNPEFPSTSFWGIQRYYYLHVGGRYSSTPLLGSLAEWYSLPVFRAVVGGLLLVHPLAVCAFFKKLGLGVFALVATALIWMAYLQQLTNCYDSLLRFTCMPIYLFGNIGLLGIASVLLGVQQAKRVGEWWLLPLLFITVGTNEIALVQAAGLVIVMIGNRIFAAKAIQFRQTALLLFLVACILLAVLAPGNFERMAHYQNGQGWAAGIWLTLGVSGYLWAGWLGSTLFVPLLLAVVLLVIRYFPNCADHPVFRNPRHWLLALVVWTPLSLFPLLYGTGGESLPERVVDLLFLQNLIIALGLILSLFGNEPALHYSMSDYLSQFLLLVVLVYFMVSAFVGGLSIDRSPLPSGTSNLERVRIRSNIGTAYFQIFKGIPQKYNQEMHGIYRQLENCKRGDCLVEPVTTTTFLGYDPLYDRIQSTGERGMGRYFGKNSLVKKAK